MPFLSIIMKKNLISLIALTIISTAGCLGTTTPADSLKNVKILHVPGNDYIPARSFYNLPEVEEIVFDGFIGHIDGFQIDNCPKLKKVTFNGPIFSTGGLQFAQNCPELTEVAVNKLALNFYLVDYPDCNKFDGTITVNGAVYNSANEKCKVIDDEDLIADQDLMQQFVELARWQMKAMHLEDPFLKRMASANKNYIVDILDKAGLTELRDSVIATYRELADPDGDKTKLQVLKESKPYNSRSAEYTKLFTYAQPDDSILQRSREYFNLDSVAGKGDDISRIKNLLYWVHDVVRHDGSSGWPDCHFNLPDLVNLAKEQERGYNCRFMAFMLTEALLAEGIPARYITCQSKAWNTDNDCHVICVAWSTSLNKWVWIDPTFAAYVSDENGLLLHPGEVRYRLQNDLPLVLNEDANWNHEEMQTKEWYLDHYMAKNLYLLSASELQQSEPEGPSNHLQGRHVILTPVGFDFPDGPIKIDDDELFWQPPY